MSESSGSTGKKVYRKPRVSRLAGELVRFVDRLPRAREPRWKTLEDQLRRASASVLTNVGEGLDESSLGDKRRLFRYAFRSCGECESALRALADVGVLQPDRAAQGLRVVKDAKMDLRRLIAWTRRAEAE